MPLHLPLFPSVLEELWRYGSSSTSIACSWCSLNKSWISLRESAKHLMLSHMGKLLYHAKKLLKYGVSHLNTQRQSQDGMQRKLTYEE